MKFKNSLIKNIVHVLTANFWMVLVGFIGSFIFPKILDIESYALYHTYLLYVGYIAILHLGFPSGMVINYAGIHYEEMDKKQYKSEVILLIIILSCFTLLFAVVWIVTGISMCGYLMMSVLPVGVTGSYKSLYQAWNMFKKFTRISIFLTSAIPVLALLYYYITKTLPGNVYIFVYLAVYWSVTIYILVQETKSIRNHKRERLFSKRNLKTEKIGLSLVIGNYVSTLFYSADKQFVKWFFGTTEFAFYSFGMSMQSLMTIFITSVAQPLFPTMAQGSFNESDYNRIKKILFIFGSFSGCVYFAVSIVVKLFITKYVGSLEIIGLYFIVFPPMAVVNCLYINLYKISGKMKTYIITLISIFASAIILNIIFTTVLKKYTGVAFATAITYYIWLFVGTKQFKFLKLSLVDFLFLLAFIFGFFFITRTMTDCVGFAVYFAFVCVLSMICYKKDIKYILSYKKNRQ